MGGSKKHKKELLNLAVLFRPDLFKVLLLELGINQIRNRE